MKQTNLDSEFIETVNVAGETRTVEELKRLYHEEKLSLTKIADMFGCSQQSVSRAFDRCGIGKRTAKEQQELQNKKKRESRGYIDENKLRELYCEKSMSMSEIGEIFNVHGKTISYWIDKFGIEKRQQTYTIPQFTFSYKHREGYAGWKGCDGRFVPVHTPVAIADGAPPQKVFNENYNIHHKNRHKSDNRPCNLELLTREEHGHKEQQLTRKLTTKKMYRKSDMHDAINFIININKYTDLF